jgi:hypothetical protein
MRDKRKLFNKAGEPRYIRCYETKRNPTIDRFVIVFTRASCFSGKDYIGRVLYVSASGNPCHPTGFWQHGEAWRHEFSPNGSRIKFSELPEQCRQLVLEEYKYLWR